MHINGRLLHYQDKPYKDALIKVSNAFNKEQIIYTITNDTILAVVGIEEIALIIPEVKENTVLISITEPEDSLEISGEVRQRYFDVCDVKFWDIERPTPKHDVIDHSIALKIKEFILKYKDKQFAIHCRAGISRSAGVAMAVECLVNYSGGVYEYSTGHSDVKNFWRYHPNRTVYERIVGA
jgi:predicted protein tyrosine phosphatase